MHYLKYPSFNACSMPRFDFFALIFVCNMYLDTTCMPRPIRPKEGKSLRIRIFAVPCFFSAELFVLFLSDFTSHPRLWDVSYCRCAQILRCVSYGRFDQPLSYVSYCRYVQPLKYVSYCRYAQTLKYVSYCRYAQPLKYVSYCRHAQPLKYVSYCRYAQTLKYMSYCRYAEPFTWCG